MKPSRPFAIHVRLKWPLLRSMCSLVFGVASATAQADGLILYSVNDGDFVRPLAKVEGGRFVDFSDDREIELLGRTRPALLSFDAARGVVVRHRIAKAMPSESPPNSCSDSLPFIALAAKTNATLLSTSAAVREIPGSAMPTALGRQLLQLTPEYVGHRASADADFTTTLITFSGRSFVLPKIANEVHVVRAVVEIDRTHAVVSPYEEPTGTPPVDHTFPHVPPASADISDGDAGEGSSSFRRFRMDVTLVVDETPAHEFTLRFFTQAWSSNIDETGNVESEPLLNNVPGPAGIIGSHLRFADLNGDGKPELIVEVSRGNSESDESPGGVLVLERVGPDWKHVSAMAFGGGC